MVGELALVCLAAYLVAGVSNGWKKQKEVAALSDKIIMFLGHTIGWFPVLLVNAGQKQYLKMTGRHPVVHLLEQRKMIEMRLCDRTMAQCNLEEVPLEHMKSIITVSVGQQAQTTRVISAFKHAAQANLVRAQNNALEASALVDTSKEFLLEELAADPSSYKPFLLPAPPVSKNISSQNDHDTADAEVDQCSVNNQEKVA